MNGKPLPVYLDLVLCEWASGDAEEEDSKLRSIAALLENLGFSPVLPSREGFRFSQAVMEDFAQNYADLVEQAAHGSKQVRALCLPSHEF